MIDLSGVPQVGHAIVAIGGFLLLPVYVPRSRLPLNLTVLFVVTVPPQFAVIVGGLHTALFFIGYVTFGPLVLSEGI